MERMERIEGVEGLKIYGGPAGPAGPVRPAEPAGARGRFGLVGDLSPIMGCALKHTPMDPIESSQVSHGLLSFLSTGPC